MLTRLRNGADVLRGGRNLSKQEKYDMMTEVDACSRATILDMLLQLRDEVGMTII